MGLILLVNFIKSKIRSQPHITLQNKSGMQNSNIIKENHVKVEIERKLIFDIIIDVFKSKIKNHMEKNYLTNIKNNSHGTPFTRLSDFSLFTSLKINTNFYFLVIFIAT